MKFGKSIGSQQIGHTKFHYVDYKILKRAVSEVVGKVSLGSGSLSDALAANCGFEAKLTEEIKQVNACFEQRHKELMELVASMGDELSLSGPVASQHCESVQDGSAAATADEPHAGSLLERLVDILHHADELRMYAVWNSVAVVKILKKRRKRTKFGLEDMAGERAGWLSRQQFFSGADFAELHAAIESLGDTLVRSELVLQGLEDAALAPVKKERLCPICLDTVSDLVELPCSHGFCWKCIVLGPIAFQPGEYRITQCPVCRQDTADEKRKELRPPSEGTLSDFLHTYFPKELRADQRGEHAVAKEALEMRDVVRELVEALLGDARRGRQDFLRALPKSRGPMGAAQKMQWLQLASTGDPLALDGTSICSICLDPLLIEPAEATLTTPCKHRFHGACVQKLEMPQCPLCREPLPHAWFLPPDHPCSECGFKALPPPEYRPVFPGGPSMGTGGYPLHQPPPASLVGAGGLHMRSYLHLTVPPLPVISAGALFLGPEKESPLHHGARISSPDAFWAGSMNGSSSSSSEAEEYEDSSADSSEAEPEGAAFAYSCLGRMLLPGRDRPGEGQGAGGG